MSTFGPEFLVNTTTGNLQFRPAVAGLPNGRFVAAWGDTSVSGDDPSGSAIRVQVFHADGTLAGDEFVAPTTTESDQFVPAIAALADGRFVVAWTDHSGSDGDNDGLAVRARIFDFDGSVVSPEFRLSATVDGDQEMPALAALSDGGFVAVWTDQAGDNSGSGIHAQMFDADGNAMGEFGVNSMTEGGQFDPVVTGLPNGGFVVAWTDDWDDHGDASPPSIRLRMFDADGVGGEELLVNSATQGNQSLSAVATLADGNVVVAWTDMSGTGTDSGMAIRARIFDDGGPIGAQFQVNTTTLNNQLDPTIAVLRDGRFVIAWDDHSESQGDTSGRAVRAELFSAEGVPQGSDFVVNTTTQNDQLFVSLAPLADGRFVAVWQDFSQTGGDTSFSAIRGQIFETRTTSVFLTGTPNPDELIGTGFDDTMSGGAGDDVFWATASGTGEDAIDGGPGIDRVIFSSPSSSYSITPVIGGFSILGPGMSTTVVTDVEFAVFTDTTIELVDPENHPPTITSNGGGDAGTATVAEGTSFVTTVTATDPDPGTEFSYFIFGSPDDNLFQFDDDGNLSFITPPDYQEGEDNTYVVLIGVSDGSVFDRQTLTVTVTESTEGRGDVATLDGVLWLHDDGTIATAAGDVGILPPGWVLVGAGNFDGDGDSDALLRAPGGAYAIWELEGGEHEVRELGVVPGRWRVRGADDFDGDGDDDILWQHDEGLVVTWEMEDSHYVVNHNLAHAGRSWQIEGTGDFDGDGDADILWLNDDGRVVTWEMRDNDLVTNHNHAAVGTSWEIEGTGDLDRDGSADILWHNPDGRVVTWAMEDGALDAVHHLPDVSASWLAAGTYDFDHDGDAAILWRHDDGRVVTWDMEAGGLLQTNDFGIVLTNWHMRVAGDFQAL